MTTLAQNAHQAKPAQLLLAVTTENTDDNHLLITIADDGPGIPLAVREAAFTPAGSTTGSGLGLSYARRATELHGGTITVATSPAGTTFTMTLPLAVPETP